MNQSSILVVAIIAAVVVIALIAWMAMRQRRTAQLRDKFGDEYERTVQQHGKRGEAEAALQERAERVSKLDIRPLTAQERDGFTNEWTEVKAVFVDSPPEAVLHADRMLKSVMQARGYPMADFNRRYEDLTVDHGEVARHYRAGHEIADRQARGEANTEDLRQAMKHYEALFDELVSDVQTPPADSTRTVEIERRGEAPPPGL